MALKVETALMFEGNAEEAMNFYVSLFDGSVTRIERYGPGEPGAEGSVKRAEFLLAGHRLAASTARSSTPSHSPRRSPSSSIATVTPNWTGRPPNSRKAGRC